MSGAPGSEDRMRDNILVVEDESDVVDILRYNLVKAGFQVQATASGNLGLEMAQKMRPNMIILDLMLPGMTGQEVCRALKADANTQTIPVMMLTARNKPHERVEGLELGADDYVTKPFSTRELVLRVQAVLKRSRAASRPEILGDGGISLDKAGFEVRLDGRTIHLTVKEFKLLTLLLEHRGSILARETLLRDVWGHGHEFTYMRVVDTLIRRLRSKLGKYSTQLESIRGEGYRFNVEAQTKPA